MEVTPAGSLAARAVAVHANERLKDAGIRITIPWHFLRVPQAGADAPHILRMRLDSSVNVESNYIRLRKECKGGEVDRRYSLAIGQRHYTSQPFIFLPVACQTWMSQTGVVSCASEKSGHSGVLRPGTGIVRRHLPDNAAAETRRQDQDKASDSSSAVIIGRGCGLVTVVVMGYRLPGGAARRPFGAGRIAGSVIEAPPFGDGKSAVDTGGFAGPTA